MTIDVEKTAADALGRMMSAGFDAAQVSVTLDDKDELNIAHNEPSLLRSTENRELTLTGLVGGRKAGTALTDLTEDAISQGIAALFERASLAPVDEANAVSSGQSKHFEQGPLSPDRDLLAQKAEELLAFRAASSPKVTIEEGMAEHRVIRHHLLTSEGSQLSCVVGSYSLQVMCTATEGGKSSSFNFTEGTAEDLSGAKAEDLFGIGEMLMDTQQQIHTKALGGNFVGDVVLAPTAVSDLLEWLIGQVSDTSLIAGSSIFRDKVGSQIAASSFSVRSRFDGPGEAPYSSDGFVAPPLTLVDSGKLTTLLPSYYGSRKTGLPHCPSGSGWAITPGKASKAALIGDISKGALVNRLSMGQPAANGDFSSVIKNSFLIENGKLGNALSETMISGNMADMLQNIVGISAEHLDLGGEDFPWIRIKNLNFS